MEKRKEKADLEQLLNSLIEKGWKPFGVSDWLRVFVNIYGEIRFEGEIRFFMENFRTLTSKESGLWQFVCENDYWVHKDTYFVEKYTYHIAIHLYQCNDYRYWLLGSSLKDESELEEFLLDNIKID